MRLVAGVVALTIVLVAAGCAATLRQPLRVRVDAEREVSVHAPNDPTDDRNVPASYFGFFPSELPVKPGDEAFFAVRSRGEPHTIALGTLVDDAVAAIEELGPDATTTEIQALPAMEALPSVLPVRTSSDGTAEVNGSAADPCYLESGVPPNSLTGGAPPCEEQSPRAFDGHQSFYNSGVLNRDDSFTLSVSEDIEPGTYAMICLVHPSRMQGTLRVLADDEARPNVAEFEEAGERGTERIANELTDAATQAIFETTADKAVAGAGAPGVSGALTTFGRETYEITAGETVSWSVYGMHTITFEAPDGNTDLFIREDDRTRLNPNVWQPAGGPAVPPEAQALVGGGTEPLVIDGGSYDGRGPHHSGVLRSVGFPPVTYRVKFPEPGTYRYRDLLHPLMEGTVEVR